MKMSRAARDVVAERLRQVTKEGYDDAHDDEHTDGSIALAAVAYAAPVKLYRLDERANVLLFADPWAWDIRYDKRPYDGNVVEPPSVYPPAVRRDLLVKAGALIIAEIDRLDRIEPQKVAPPAQTKPPQADTRKRVKTRRRVFA